MQVTSWPTPGAPESPTPTDVTDAPARSILRAERMALHRLGRDLSSLRRDLALAGRALTASALGWLRPRRGPFRSGFRLFDDAEGGILITAQLGDVRAEELTVEVAADEVEVTVLGAAPCRRRVVLPESADAVGGRATLRNGELEIRLPLVGPPDPRPRRIDVAALDRH